MSTRKVQPEAETSLFSKEQIELLQKLIYQQSSSPSPPTSIGLVAQKGNFSVAMSTQMEKKSPWIVDSGASDHMTGNATLFHTYSPKFWKFYGLNY